ncbi:MAG TPA: prolyl oligopeptidase family serine peptidase [Terriglobales bacterium]|nr:prolyl oligopeptidase family serine peptidase [Terriglobales bacterium]
MFRLKLRLWYVGLAFLECAGMVAAQTARQPVTIENLINIKHPSNPVWSPDGKHIAFLWDRADIVNLYLANADGAGDPIALTSFPDGKVTDVFWSKDGNTIYFSQGGDLWQVAASGGVARAVWTTPAAEAQFSPSPDGTRVAFIRAGSTGEVQHGADLIIRSMSDGSDSKIAHDDESIYEIKWSPDGSQIAYIGGSKVIRHDESPSYSGEKLIYAVFEYAPGQLYVVPAAGGKPTAIDTQGEYNGLAWTDSAHLTYDRQSNAFKTRTIYLAGATGDPPRAIHEDKEDKFWSLPDWEAEAKPKPSPDGKWICFLTDLDGWDHLYVMPAEGGNPVQITKGHFEAWRPTWSHDSTRIAFDANEPDHAGDRRVGMATISGDPAHATVTYLTTGRGTNVAPQWSPNDQRLVYQHTDTQNSADLFVVDTTARGRPIRLSNSMPAGIDHSAFVEPQFVTYPGPDGKPVPAWLFVPKNLDLSKKHAAIIWAHGDGINQNYDGWHIQRNYAVYYSYHQYLLQEGYVILAPDYRGSIGYGRDWRNGVYMDVGGNDAKDAWMGANYLKTLPYVDAHRIGIWGLSYGGFFTLIAMTDQPTLFRAAVDVAGVADYVMYYHDPFNNDWTEGRMGTPQQNPKVYANASPISHIDQLAHPLLVLHGTADVNVPFLQSVWLMDEALKKNKGNLVQLMIYPGEFHYFSREHVLRDAWTRVDQFFAFHLRGVGPKP